MRSPLPARRLPRAALALATALAATTLLTGCASIGGSKKSEPAAEPLYRAPDSISLGRVLSHDAAAGTALVELAPFSQTPATLDGRAMIARHPATLEPTAQLVGSRWRSGRVVGVKVVEGAPAPDDEVVLAP